MFFFHYYLHRSYFLLNFLVYVLDAFPACLLSTRLNRDTVELCIRSPRNLRVFAILRDHFFFSYEQLTELVAIDYLLPVNRFSVIYNLLSIRYNTRLQIRFLVDVSGGLPSLVSLYLSSGWLEREAWDMFGIFFFSNPDLRRILTDYGFQGHPLRKDFPLSGFSEVLYSSFYERIIKQPVSFAQEHRDFHYRQPVWLKN